MRRLDETPPLGELAAIWVDGRRARGEISELTAKRYRRSLFRFVDYVGPERHVASIKPADFEKWLVEIKPSRNRHFKASSLNTTAAPVRAFFGWCRVRNYITADPTAETGKAKVPERPPRRLTREAVEKLIATAEFRERTQLILLANLGLRLSELGWLYVEDYDRVGQHLTVVRGKGDRSRVLPIIGETKVALDAWIDHGLRQVSGPMWPSPVNFGEPMGSGFIGRRLSAHGVKVGIRFTPHQLRHTCASEMVEGGVDLGVVQAVLGHKSLTSTTVYVSSSPEHIRAALAGRPGYLRGDEASGVA